MPHELSGEELLDVSDVAKYLDVTSRSVLYMIQRGELAGTKVGHRWRLRRSDIDAYIQKEKNKLDFPMPSWWISDAQSWQDASTEIAFHLPTIIQNVTKRLEAAQGKMTKDSIRLFFIEELIDQHLNRIPIAMERRRVAEFLATLPKIDTLLKPIASQSQKEPFLDEKSSILLQQYCSAQYERWKMLDLPWLRRPISVPLEDVFVATDLLTGTEKQNVHSRHNLRDVISENDRLVVIGNPGSGKTILLRHLLLNTVEEILKHTSSSSQSTTTFPLPLYISLRSYAEVWNSSSVGYTLIDMLPRYLHLDYLDRYADFLQDQFYQQNVMLLLDGLDEVADINLRSKIVREVELIAQSYPGNHYVITSRPNGYRKAPFGARFQLYTLADYTEEQAITFLQKWIEHEEILKGREAGNYLQDAKEKAEALFKTVQSKSELKMLATNPLSLTLLGLAHFEGFALQIYRNLLFDLFITAFLDPWLKTKGKDLTFSQSEFIETLSLLALWIHEHSAARGISQEELIEQIAIQASNENKTAISKFEVAKRAEQFLVIAEGTVGLLIERGWKRYGFVNLAFEEHFAAMALARYMDTNKRNNFIREHLDQNWQDIIPIAVNDIGILQGKEVTELMQHAILKVGNPSEADLHNLRFAGLCLSDNLVIENSLEDEIIESIVIRYLICTQDEREMLSDVLKWWAANTQRIAQHTTNLVVSMLHRWQRMTPLFDEKTTARYAQFMRNIEEVQKKRVPLYAVMLLHQLGVETDEYIDYALKLLSDADPYIKKVSATLLEQVSSRRPEVSRALLKMLTDTGEH